ncbi:MAG: RNA polymerase sigma factor [Candidatus Nealsonbacteria bacterium]
MGQKSREDFKILVERAQNGSKDAFRDIFDRLSNRFFAYIFSRTSNRDDALDITQEIFIELWNALNKFQYRSDEAFYGFIFTITKRKLFRYYKDKHKIVSLHEGHIRQAELKQEDHRFLLKQLDALGQKYQDLLRLRYWSGMTFSEIAAVLNITETTAKVRHHRALQKLKINLKKENCDF